MCKPQPGDRCPECGHYYVTVNTRIIPDAMLRVRYIGCRRCGHRPPDNRIEVPLRDAPPMRQRFRATDSPST